MPQPEKPLDPSASPAAWFGAEVRHRRKAAGYVSAARFAADLQVSVDLLLKLEKGVYRCPADLPPRLDDLLETGGLFRRSWPMAFDADKSGADADTSRQRGAQRPGLMLEGSILGGSTPLSGSDPMHRRAILAIGGLAALAPLDLLGILTPSAELPVPERISTREINLLVEYATTLQRWDTSFGGGGFVGLQAHSAMRWAVALLSVSCPDKLRTDFLAAVARLGLVAGACQFDSLQHEKATTAFKIAVECAEEVRQWDLRAKGYSFLARQAVWTGDADDALTYAEKGLVRSDRLTATEQAMLHTARARAWGKLGSVQETLAAVGAADDAFSRRQPQNDPAWMRYYDEAQHNGDTAYALYDLSVGTRGHNPALALQRFADAVRGHGDHYPRSRAMSSIKLASLVLATGDPAEGIALGLSAAAYSDSLTSKRASTELVELGRVAGSAGGTAGSAELRHKIRATVRG
ncbi:XRE family transcriptional regulator [Kitasatospora sp. NPDC096128]|uniref:XRE family transcriptional regulator n=1 Tax=Kitasatospora sp. NPDC096128 TaxID=3155547 RepID=UPI0033331E20